MNLNDAVIDPEFEEMLDFLREICTRFHLNRDNPSFNEREYLRWVVVEAGTLYIVSGRATHLLAG
jgi:hypothetical protein